MTINEVYHVVNTVLDRAKDLNNSKDVRGKKCSCIVYNDLGHDRTARETVMV